MRTLIGTLALTLSLIACTDRPETLSEACNEVAVDVCAVSLECGTTRPEHAEDCERFVTGVCENRGMALTGWETCRTELDSLTCDAMDGSWIDATCF